MSDLVGNPEDRFSRVEAHYYYYYLADMVSTCRPLLHRPTADTLYWLTSKAHTEVSLKLNYVKPVLVYRFLDVINQFIVSFLLFKQDKQDKVIVIVHKPIIHHHLMDCLDSLIIHVLFNIKNVL